jgi:hypothetical protein
MEATGTGLGGGAGSYVVGPDGRMTGGAITIDRGNNGSGGGWYIDPDPEDFSEFNGDITNAFAVNAPAGSPANGLSDFYTIVSAEMTHVLGINSNSTTLFNAAGTREWTDSGVSDTAEGGGIGTFHLFDGDFIDHLMTSNNGGSSGSDRNVPLHGAGPITTVISGQTWVGAQDAMNAVYEGSRRYLVPETSRLIMQDAFGYTTVNAQQFGTAYANLNRATNVLTLRGGDTHNASAQNDVFSIGVSGSNLIVSVDVPSDVGGTWTSRGAGNFPAWSTTIPISEVTQIVINAEEGDDDIFINSLPSTITVSVVGGEGNDFVQFGNGDIDSDVFGDATVNGGNGTDSVSFFDLLDDIGNDIYNITNNYVEKNNGGGRVTYQSTVERVDVSASGQDNRFDVNSASSVTDIYLNGLGGNDTFDFVVDFDTLVQGQVSCLGGNGTDTILIDDSADTLADDYLFTGNRYEKTSGGSGTIYASSSVENVDITANPLANTITIPQMVSTLNLTFDGGDGADNFVVGNGNLTANLLGSLTIAGGIGTDSLLLNDASDTGDDSYSVTSSTAGKTGGLVGYGTLEELRLACNGGANDIVINSTTVMDYIVTGNSGNDNFEINDGSSFLFNIGGQITLQGNAGDDSLTITDTGFAGTGNYTLTNGNIALPFNATNVAHQTMESLSVTGSNGNNTFNVNSNNIFALIAGDDGDDTINIGNGDFDTNITANVLVVGGVGNDVAVVQDTADSSNATFNISNSSFGKNTTTALLQYNFFGPTIDNIVVNAGGGSSLFNVQSIGSSTTAVDLNVNAGSGNDTFAVTAGNLSSALFGTVTLDGQGSADVVDIYDGADTGADTYSLDTSGSFNRLNKTGLTLPLQYAAESVALNANPDANTITVTAHFPGLIVSASSGADTINILGNAVGSSVTVRGGLGMDNVNVNTDNVGTATVVTDGNEDWNSLNIGTGGRLNQADGTIFSDATTITGILDLGVQGQYIHSGAATVATINGLLRNGYNSGAWTGTQPAILSSFAANAVSTKDGVGLARAGDIAVATFGGWGVTANDLLLGRTQYGDTDLDTDVDFDDLLRLAQNYGFSPRYWWQGNFDFDAGNLVDFPDLLVLAQNYGFPLSQSEMIRAGVGASAARKADSVLTRSGVRNLAQTRFSDDLLV